MIGCFIIAAQCSIKSGNSAIFGDYREDVREFNLVQPSRFLILLKRVTPVGLKNFQKLKLAFVALFFHFLYH